LCFIFQRLTIPRSCPPCFSRLMSQCWELEPKKRPSFRDILSFLDFGLTHEHTNHYTTVCLICLWIQCQMNCLFWSILMFWKVTLIMYINQIQRQTIVRYCVQSGQNISKWWSFLWFQLPTLTHQTRKTFIYCLITITHWLKLCLIPICG
jgi:hypothetical protein